MDPRFARAIHGLRYVCASCMCVGSVFMPRGMCQLTTNERSIMVDQAAFDDFITRAVAGGPAGPAMAGPVFGENDPP